MLHVAIISYCHCYFSHSACMLRSVRRTPPTPTTATSIAAIRTKSTHNRLMHAFQMYTDDSFAVRPVFGSIRTGCITIRAPTPNCSPIKLIAWARLIRFNHLPARQGRKQHSLSTWAATSTKGIRMVWPVWLRPDALKPSDLIEGTLLMLHFQLSYNIIVMLKAFE